MDSIAILGAGPVGGVLGRIWAQAGRRVVFGSRDPAAPKVAALVDRCGALASAASFEDAVAQTEAAAVALPWAAVAETLPPLTKALCGKLVIDATNPLGVVDGRLGLVVGHNDSGGEIVERLLAGAHVVKAFNTLGYDVIADPAFPGGRSALFIAGNNPACCAEVATLARACGFDPIDCGPLRAARLTEAHAMLWIDLAQNRGLGRDFAFVKVTRADDAQTGNAP
jgi:predicted dinucleotide-binding enzyme